MTRLELSFLGSYQVKLGGELVTGFEADKVRALLVYLAVESDHPHRREQLAALFWPSWPDASARTSLRNALSNLRQAIGDETAEPHFLTITREIIQFNSQSDYWLDLAEFERLAAEDHADAERLQSALGLYRGSFLEGFTLKDCPAFDDWSTIVRERVQQQTSAFFSRLAEMHAQNKDYEKAIACARKRLELEPWQEDAHRQLMRLLALSGQRLAALVQFEACKRSLKTELGVEPSAETVRLYESIRDSQPSEPTPAKVHPHSLPAQLTSFIGREKEIAQVQSLLKTHRLVTLTGPGGTGKTRLGLRVAEEMLEEYPDGAWLVELAPVSDPNLVPMIAARALGLREQTSAQTLTLLQDFLASKRLLLIFDNCEHLIEACAFLADTLLHACARLSILVSSREALGIEGEAPLRVPPLTIPKLEQLPAPEELMRCEAIRLFGDRAETILPGFSLTSANLPAVALICKRLDGIPLAIELAAARVRLLQVEEIAKHLEDRFRLLTGGSRAALPRYQTLRASIDWSYALLSTAEQTLLQRLSVFAGSWTLEAAEAACSGEGIPSGEVLELQGQLVDKSLVSVEAQAGPGTRYRMLETIRQYAHEKLVERGEAGQMRQRHLGYYLELTEKVGSRLRGPELGLLLDLLEAELDNLRLALEWSLESREQPWKSLEAGLRIASAMLWFWHPHGRHVEGIQWLERLLRAEAEGGGQGALMPERIRLRAEAFFVAAWLAHCVGERAKSIPFAEQSRDLHLKLGEAGRHDLARDMIHLGILEADKGNIPEANRLLKESLAFFQEKKDSFWESDCLLYLGQIAWNNLEFEAAQEYYEEDLRIKQAIGDQDGIGAALLSMGWLAFDQGEDEQARKFCEHSLRIFSAIHNSGVIFLPLFILARLELRQGNYARADERFQEQLSLGYQQGNIAEISSGLTNLGLLALVREDLPEAEARYAESLALNRKYDQLEDVRFALWNLGNTAWVKGDLEKAAARFTEALTLAQEAGDQIHEGNAHFGLGRVAIAYGEVGRAREHLVKALGSCFTYSMLPWDFPYALEALAFVAMSQQQMTQAARLLGVTQAYHERFLRLRTPKEREMRRDAMAQVCVSMGEEAFAAACKEGEGMGLKQAVRYICEG
jgi:predicted ATPase/DNA-binding SARP family transcriptional activator